MKNWPSFLAIDLSIITSYLPSQAKLADASEFFITGGAWMGKMAVDQIKCVGFWSLQSAQDVYAYDWKNFSFDDISFESALQLVSVEGLTGEII